ncbi:unnamed protein product [Somion occarium]|uniref:Uncharacterized protein n=1 Tax=Somion occarium TaxID=3059160 RepID=A0ABP1CTZ2_9APHY
MDVETSRAKRLEKQQSRYRDRGGIFVPAETNPLLEVLLARGPNGESPSKYRHGKRSPSRRESTRDSAQGRLRKGEPTVKSGRKSTPAKSKNKSTKSTRKSTTTGGAAASVEQMDAGPSRLPAASSSRAVKSKVNDKHATTTVCNESDSTGKDIANTGQLGKEAAPASKVVQVKSSRTTRSKGKDKASEHNDDVRGDHDDIPPPAKTKAVTRGHKAPPKETSDPGKEGAATKRSRAAEEADPDVVPPPSKRPKRKTAAKSSEPRKTDKVTTQELAPPVPDTLRDFEQPRPRRTQQATRITKDNDDVQISTSIAGPAGGGPSNAVSMQKRQSSRHKSSSTATKRATTVIFSSDDEDCEPEPITRLRSSVITVSANVVRGGPTPGAKQPDSKSSNFASEDRLHTIKPRVAHRTRTQVGLPSPPDDDEDSESDVPLAVAVARKRKARRYLVKDDLAMRNRHNASDEVAPEASKEQRGDQKDMTTNGQRGVIAAGSSTGLTAKRATVRVDEEELMGSDRDASDGMIDKKKSAARSKPGTKVKTKPLKSSSRSHKENRKASKNVVKKKRTPLPGPRMSMFPVPNMVPDDDDDPIDLLA